MLFIFHLAHVFIFYFFFLRLIKYFYLMFFHFLHFPFLLHFSSFLFQVPISSSLWIITPHDLIVRASSMPTIPLRHQDRNGQRGWFHQAPSELQNCNWGLHVLNAALPFDSHPHWSALFLNLYYIMYLVIRFLNY